MAGVDKDSYSADSFWPKALPSKDSVVGQKNINLGGILRRPKAVIVITISAVNYYRYGQC